MSSCLWPAMVEKMSKKDVERGSGLAVGRGSERHEAAVDAVQALGVADQEVAARAERRQQPPDHLALGLVVEIDHDVAQKDDVEHAERWQRMIEVDLSKLDPAPQGALDEERPLVAAETLETEALEILRRHVGGPLHGVVPDARPLEDARADVRAHHLPGLPLHPIG